MQEKINAVVLKAVDYGEYDKMLTLLSFEEGKISAGIKGVKKASAKLKFAAQPFAFCEYVLSRTGSKNTVIGAMERESFYEFRTDIIKFYCASAACEAVCALCIDSFSCPDLFNSLVTSLAKMCSKGEKKALASFLLNALALSGYGISAGMCPVCGENLLNGKVLSFDMNMGSFTCERCSEGPKCSPKTHEAVCCLLQGDEEGVCDEALKRVFKLIKEYMRYRLNFNCKSLGELIQLI